MSNTKGTSAIVPPQGGGAQSGLGEKFSPDLFTGTGNFSVPIAVPPGRNGFQPELTLGYSSGNGNGTFGLGWALGIPGVTRKTAKGVPVYDDRKDIFILSGAEDLVPVKKESTPGHEKTFYRPRTEGLFARIVHHKKSNGENYWEVRSKDGLVSYYGTPDAFGSAQSSGSGQSIEDPCVIANPENRNSIFAWCLSKTVDPYGNEIIYEYDRELVTETTKASPHKYDQLYLSSIKYAQYMDEGEKKYLCEVKFNYEERDDAFSAYRQGFEMRTTKRCVNIETYTHADETRKTKTYHFNYLSGEKLPLNGVSMLESVSVEGHKSEDSEWMPPLEFGYSKFKPSRRGLKNIEGPIPVMSLSQPGFELADLNGNGLPDLLQLDGVARYWTNQGNGKLSNPRMLELAPSVQLGQPGVQLIDANGNGRNDLLVANGVMNGYFPGEYGGVWSQRQFRPYSQAPSVNFADPEVQLMDLDGDGMTDVLRNGAKFECFFNNPQKGFDRVRVTENTFADFSFADPRIRFADMTGDGLQDIVLISSGRVQYWPNIGYGRFGQKVNMKNAPRFPEQYNPAQVLVGDLDGDGLADIAFVENNSVTLYVNQSANGFSEGTKIVNTPAVFDPNDLRITDILGTGQPGILWSMAGTDGRHGKMYFLDFTDNNKPYVLEEMNNNMGSLTRVEYGSSIYQYLRDQKNPKTRWQTELPFPVQVVNRVEVLDLLSGGKLATEYRYHNGYWDGAEREFRGFARVDTVDTETFEKFNSPFPFDSAQGAGSGNQGDEVSQMEVTSEQYTPPVETRSWFYPGPVGEDFTRWHEVDFSDEYWQGDENVLERTQEMKALLASLPRRARRDALRTMRGTLLRSETYGLDGSTLQDRPYTVTESLMSVRLEFDPSELPSPLWAETLQGYWAGGGYIFFPFNVAQRTTQYERGDDPMHSMSFVKDYDAYGHPLGELSIGLPRGSSPNSGGNGNYLATYGESEFIYKDVNGGQYMVDRVKRSVSYDATKPAGGTSVFAFKDGIFDSQATLDVIGCSLNFYDGDAFDGLPYGEIGDFGAVVRSETLVLTEGVVTDVYGGTPALLEQNPSWPSDYPIEFQNLYPNQGGYVYKTANNEYPIAGWYAPSEKMKYDFQDSGIQNPVGLMIESKSVFDKLSSTEYDDFLMFPIKTTDANGLVTESEYDFRILEINKIIDSNENISLYDFSPLGLLQATALIGKGTEGDYKSDEGSFYERYAPSTFIQYNFRAFIEEGNPVWAKTIRREKHWQDDPSTDSPTIIKVDYSDGFGRLLQTRTQAEDVIFGNQTFGSSGLSSNQVAQNASAIGIERSEQDPLNVIVNGWSIFNNKGEIVEQYEPFFDKGFDYTLPQLSISGGIIPPQLGVKFKMYMDPLGRVIRTINPDKGEERIIFGIPNALDTPNSFAPSPWEQYAYDANDLAPLTHPNDNTIPTSHYYTPKSSLLDSFGRTIQTIEHKAYYNEDTSDYENVVMRYFYDIRGNLLEVRDPYNRKVFEHLYDLKPPQEDENGEQQSLPPLWTKHIDLGISTVFFDAASRPTEMSDSKGAFTLNSYDNGSRPILLWAKDKSGEDVTLRQIMEYGDNAGLTNPENENLKGQLYKHYDEAGLVEIPEYDFKGNVLTNKRQCISDTELMSVFNGPPANWEVDCYRVDWTGMPSILDAKVFETNSEYDALNRITKVTYPEDADSNRKVEIPSYNRAGALQKVVFDETEYVEYIAYNAKGQRLLIAYGNGIMTRYAYDNKSIRLRRLKSEKFTQSGWEFSPNSGTVKQDYAYINDLIGNIVEINDKSPDCGVGGTNSLDREFEYDPLYRLIEADGRENNPSTPFPWWDDSYRSTDNSLTTAYTQHYEYDKLGNIQKLQHIGDTLFTRNFDYSGANNKLNDISVGMNTYSYLYDNAGNQIQENSNRFFEWDFNNKMRSYYNQAGTAEPTVYEQYLYDSAGNRIKKIVRSQGGDYTSTSYINGVFDYKTDGSDEQVTTYITDDSSKIAFIRTGDDFGDTTPAIKYNLEDHLNSSAKLLNISGSLINSEEYYPFGETSFGSYAKKRYRYSGKERDEESGLYYFGARYYSPMACRFTSVDPEANQLEFESGYTYCRGNPLVFVDDDGEFPIFGAIVLGFLVGAGSDLFMQMVKNTIKYAFGKGKKLGDGLLKKAWKAVDWADVAIAGIAGAVMPGSGVFSKAVYNAGTKNMLKRIIKYSAKALMFLFDYKKNPDSDKREFRVAFFKENRKGAIKGKSKSDVWGDLFNTLIGIGLAELDFNVGEDGVFSSIGYKGGGSKNPFYVKHENSDLYSFNILNFVASFFTQQGTEGVLKGLFYKWPFSTKIMKKWLGLNDKSSKGIEIPTSRSEIEWPKGHGSGEGQDFFEQMQIKESMNNLEISN